MTLFYSARRSASEFIASLFEFIIAFLPLLQILILPETNCSFFPQRKPKKTLLFVPDKTKTLHLSAGNYVNILRNNLVTIYELTMQNNKIGVIAILDLLLHLNLIISSKYEVSPSINKKLELLEKFDSY